MSHYTKSILNLTNDFIIVKKNKFVFKLFCILLSCIKTPWRYLIRIMFICVVSILILELRKKCKKKSLWISNLIYVCIRMKLLLIAYAWSQRNPTIFDYFISCYEVPTWKSWSHLMSAEIMIRFGKTRFCVALTAAYDCTVYLDVKYFVFKNYYGLKF